MSSGFELSDRRREVLAKLYEGKYASLIADELDVTRQAVHRHVKALKEEGLIREDPQETEFYRRSLGGGTSIKIYGLTDPGLEALQQGARSEADQNLTTRSRGTGEVVKDSDLHRRDEPVEPRVEVHNFEVKIPVVEQGIEWLPNAAEMNNWTRRWDENFHGVYLEVTTQHILLKAGAEASSKATAEGLCLRKLLRVMELLEEHYGCKLGRPEFRAHYQPGKTKIGVTNHPLAKSQDYQQGELATIDDTPEEGTIHPTDDPEDADRIVQMARRAERTETLLEGLVEQQTRFFASLSRLLGAQEGTEPADHDPGMEIQ